LTRIRLPHRPHGHPGDGEQVTPRALIFIRSQLLAKYVPQPLESWSLQPREESSSPPRIYLDAIDIVIFCLVFFLAVFTAVMTFIGRKHSKTKGCRRFLCFLRQSSSCITEKDSEKALPASDATTASPHLKAEDKEEVPLEVPRMPAAAVPMFSSSSERDLVERAYS
jgi:hypothetical protein